MSQMDPVELFRNFVEATENNQPQKARHFRKLLLHLGWDVRHVLSLSMESATERMRRLT